MSAGVILITDHSLLLIDPFTIHSFRNDTIPKKESGSSHYFVIHFVMLRPGLPPPLLSHGSLLLPMR